MAGPVANPVTHPPSLVIHPSSRPLLDGRLGCRPWLSTDGWDGEKHSILSTQLALAGWINAWLSCGLRVPCGWMHEWLSCGLRVSHGWNEEGPSRIVLTVVLV